MEVFHWVALQLKDVPIFSCPLREKKKEGAYYNDFDNENPFSSDDSDDLEFSFTQPSVTDKRKTSSQPGCSRSSSKSKTFEEVLDETYYMLEHFDRYSPNPDKEYRKKVYLLLKEEADSLKIPLTNEIYEIYLQRHAMDWSGADTVYDLFLLGMQLERSWFPYEVFEAEYPNYQSLIDRIVDQYAKDHDTDRDDDDFTVSDDGFQSKEMIKEQTPTQERITEDGVMAISKVKIEISSSDNISNFSDPDSNGIHEVRPRKKRRLSLKKYEPKKIISDIIVISD